jgi:hypothetical protein
MESNTALSSTAGTIQVRNLRLSSENFEEQNIDSVPLAGCLDMIPWSSLLLTKLGHGVGFVFYSGRINVASNSLQKPRYRQCVHIYLAECFWLLLQRVQHGECEKDACTITT